jgi:hypothetical protein
MRRRRTDADLKKFVDDIKARQKNTVWPDALVNSRRVDEFFWKGSRDRTLVQRIGAWLFGLCYMVGGLVSVSVARREGSLLLVIFSSVWLYVGARVLLNGFRKYKQKTRPE